MKARNRISPEKEHEICALYRRQINLTSAAVALECEAAAKRREARKLSIAGIARIAGVNWRTVERVLDEREGRYCE